MTCTIDTTTLQLGWNNLIWIIAYVHYTCLIVLLDKQRWRLSKLLKKLRFMWSNDSPIFCLIFKSNLSLSSLYSAEAWNELEGPISASLHLGQHRSKKCRSGGKLLATLRPIWPVRDLNLKLPASETNALPLDQLAVWICIILNRTILFLNYS